MAPENKIEGDLVFFTTATWDKIKNNCDPPEHFKGCYSTDPDVAISLDYMATTAIVHGMAHDTRQPRNIASGSLWLIPQNFDGTLIFPGSDGGLLQLDDNMEEYTFRSARSGFIFVVKKEDYHYDLWIDNESVEERLLPRKSRRSSVIRLEVENGQQVKIKKVHKLDAHRKRNN